MLASAAGAQPAHIAAGLAGRIGLASVAAAATARIAAAVVVDTVAACGAGLDLDRRVVMVGDRSRRATLGTGSTVQSSSPWWMCGW